MTGRVVRKDPGKACHDCRDWSDCPGKPWYSIADIRYCRYQVLWIIENFIVCNAGKSESERDTWPVEEQDTGYTEAPKTSHAVSAHAPFERTLQVVGDITRRLERTGKDGRLLVLEVHNSVPLSQDARNALNYVNGWREKHRSYTQWLADRKYRKK